MKDIYKNIGLAAKNDSNVLIIGDTFDTLIYVKYAIVALVTIEKIAKICYSI